MKSHVVQRFSKLRALSFGALATLNLISQNGKTEIHFANLEVVRGRIGPCQKFLVRLEGLFVLLKIIMRGGDEKVRRCQVGTRRRNPFVFGKRARKSFISKGQSRDWYGPHTVGFRQDYGVAGLPLP
jgi:hypothetical protein